MKTFNKVTGYVKNVSNGCAFVQSAAAEGDIIFVQPELAKGLEVGATVILDAAESWNDKAGKFGVRAIHIYSVDQPQKATAFAHVNWFDMDKGFGFAILRQGDHIDKSVRLSAAVIKAAGFSKDNKPGAKMPCKLVFIVLNDGDKLMFDAEKLETGSEIASAMKKLLAETPALAVVANDQTSQEVDASKAA